MHGEDFQPAVQGVTCPGSVNNSNCAYNFLCVALKIHPTDFSSMSSNSAAIYYSLRVETRTLKLQNGSGCLRSPPFPTLFPVSINQREGPRSAQTKQERIPKGCSASCVVMAPWPWPGLCWSPDGPWWSADVWLCVDLFVSPLEAWQRSGPGGVVQVWMARGGKAQLQCGVESIPTGAQKVGEVAAATRQEQVNSPKVRDWRCFKSRFELGY